MEKELDATIMQHNKKTRSGVLRGAAGAAEEAEWDLPRRGFLFLWRLRLLPLLSSPESSLDSGAGDGAIFEGLWGAWVGARFGGK